MFIIIISLLILIPRMHIVLVLLNYIIIKLLRYY